MESSASTHLLEESRFEIRIGEHLAVLDYCITGDSMTIHHTFVPPELRGKGLAAVLAEAALNFAKASELKVTPQCSYIATYIEQTQSRKPYYGL